MDEWDLRRSHVDRTYEEWRLVEEATRYDVSNYGFVKNRNTGRIQSPGLAGYGYKEGGGYQVVQIFIDHESRYRMRYVHELVAEAFLGLRPPGCEVNHIDTDKHNNHVDNLEWLTKLENIQHAARLGRYANGGTPRTRVRIIETGEVFESQGACARAIGGRQSTIHACLNGRLRDNTHMGYHFEYVD